MMSVVPEAVLLVHADSVVPAWLRQVCSTVEQPQLSKHMTNTKGQ